MKISAIILGAGKGSRIGTPKLMLEINNKSFVNVIIDKVRCAGIEDICCTVNDDTFKWAKENIDDCKIAVNPEPEKGMISSVYYGTMKLEECDGVLVIPVDHPFVEVDTYKSLISEFEKNNNSVIKPGYEGKSGHPVLVPYKIAVFVSKESFSGGLKEVIKKSGLKQIYVEVNDKGILKNINTKEDLKDG
jgi:molybdenum cofactor cytidylyltransferase